MKLGTHQFGVTMILTTTWFGTFLIEPKSGKIIKKKLFPKKIPKLIEQLIAIQNQEILTEERSLVKGLKEPITVTDERLKALGELVEAVSPLPKMIELTAEDFGFKPELYHEVMLELGKQRTRLSIGADNYIIQAVKGLDDLTHAANLLSERLHEWYGLHWPELDKIIKESEYVHVVSELGDRDSIIKEVKNERVRSLTPADSVGNEIDIEDKAAVMGFAKQLKSVNSSRVKLEDYLKTRMEILAPNITHLAGPIIGARLLALTGGLSRLAKVTSSTIQLLGAEKALFRHLRDGELPPKHGIIFQHPTIHNAPYWQRGKIARAFAGKIAIAAKLDHNSNKFIGEELEEGLKRRVDEIRKKYPKPPAKKKSRGGAKTRAKRGKRRSKDKKTRRGKRRKKL